MAPKTAQAKGASQPAVRRLAPAPKQRPPMTARPALVRGRVFVRKERCKGCEFCAEFCPQGVLVMAKEFNAKGYHYPLVVKDECINCTLCITICPDYAIMSVPVPAGAEARAAAKKKR